MALPAVGGDLHAASPLVVDDGPPMGAALFYCHLVHPDNEDLSLSGCLIQLETEQKTGGSDGYKGPRGIKKQ